MACTIDWVPVDPDKQPYVLTRPVTCADRLVYLEDRITLLTAQLKAERALVEDLRQDRMSLI